MDFYTPEEIDGVRFTWNALPQTKLEASKTVVPFASVYKPLLARADLPLLQYEPVVCHNQECKSILNPYSMLDLASKTWICALCGKRNNLPTHYTAITPENLPVELQPGGTTVEYILNRKVHSPLVFVYVVDLCQERASLDALKDTILVSLSLLPPDALVGLITFGTCVNVYELAAQGCTKSFAFRGNKEYTSQQIQDALGFMSNDLKAKHHHGQANTPLSGSHLSTSSRYFQPCEEVQFALGSILEELQPDSFSIAPSHRAQRATGSAIRMALTILGSAFPNTVARVMLFASGPCTIGPGAVVDINYKNPIRSHHDIRDSNAKLYLKAKTYYESLTKVATSYGHVVDIFAGCYDQVGLAEMASLADRTGGAMVITDDFQTSIFKQSFQRLLAKDGNNDLEMAFNANFEIKTSTNLKVCGLLGQAVSLNNKSSYVSETTEIGLAKTSSWKMCGITPSSTYTVFFEIGSKQPTMTPANVPGNLSDASSQRTAQGLIQYITHYQHASGQYRLRVTTVARALYPGSSPLIAQSFDQETAAVVLAKLAMFKFESDKMSSDDIIKWVDKLLVQLCAKFGEYRRDDIASFKLKPEFSMLPQFIFHLRRSQFLQVFNNSPDETTFYRHMLMNEDVANCLTMIQPSLTSYALDSSDGGPAPVLLDSLSVKPDTILLLDTFFHILIFHGETIAAWRKAGYQNQEEYSNLAALLAAPRADAAELLVDRFPLPRFIDTEAGGSQARFLFSKLNPTNSYREMDGFGYSVVSTGAGVGGAGGVDATTTVVLTDDVSLQSFMLHLSKLCVSQKES